eukprot:m.159781 g.159781  ORF g.159781 m.159781 type:complete len:903 (-) comp13377_c2_seq2:1983-4691(-)
MSEEERYAHQLVEGVVLEALASFAPKYRNGGAMLNTNDNNDTERRRESVSSEETLKNAINLLGGEESESQSLEKPSTPRRRASLFHLEYNEVKRLRRSSCKLHLLPQAKVQDMKRFIIQSEEMRKAKDSSMKRYMDKHNLPGIFEALMTSAAIMQPEDHRRHILSLLYKLQGFQGLVTWNMFIPEDKCPPRRILPYWMLRGEEDDNTPTPEMYHVARVYNSRRVLGPVFKEWMNWYRRRQVLKKRLFERLEMALQHYQHSIVRKYFKPLVERRRINMERRAMVLRQMQNARTANLLQIVFSAWKKYTEHARLASLYFEEISRAQAKDHDLLAQEGDNFTALPFHLRVKIFTYLGLLDRMECLRVCRTWREVAQSPVLWNSVFFTEMRNKCQDAAISYVVMKYQPFLCKVNLRGCYRVTNYGFSLLGQCSNLQDLNLSECAVLRDAALKVVVEGCPSLMYLNLSSCGITDLSLKYLSQNCDNLCYLSLACCENITPLGCGFFAEGTGCDQLTWLDLSSCPRVDDEGLKLIGAKCGLLSTVLLNDLVQISDEGLISICSICPFLDTLSIRRCTSLTNVALEGLGKYCSKLKHLELSENKHFTTDGFRALSSKMKLKTLVVEDCARVRDGVMQCICKHPLEYLSIERCGGITDSGMKQLAQGRARDHLQFLRLSHLTKVTDTGMRSIQRACGNLYHLDLSGCVSITDLCLEPILCSCERLTTLNLNGCAGVGDGLLKALKMSHIFSITWLDLSGCVELTDLTLEGITQVCPHLVHLSLTGCVGITDKGFKEFSIGCGNLQWLSLAYCEQLTDQCLSFIAAACRNLSTLHLFGITSISNASIEKLLAHIAGLKTISLISSSKVTHGMVVRLRERNQKVKIHYDMEEPEFETGLPLRTVYDPELFDE